MSKNEEENSPTTMASWQMLAYDGKLHLQEETPLPKLANDTEVLIKVITSSINNLDCLMLEGYGHVLLNCAKRWMFWRTEVPTTEFPVILGRDFVGEIVAVGKKVKPEYSKGTIVMGLSMPPRDGSHAEYVAVNQNHIVIKPDNVEPVDAVSYMYAGMTAWTALCSNGGLSAGNGANKKVLVIGAAGGVGTVAVQMLKSWGATVVATCSTSAIPLVEKFKPDKILDYTKSTYFDELREQGPYNVILDAAGLKTDISKFTELLKPYGFSKYVSLLPPTLENTDKYGVVLGLAKTAFDYLAVNLRQASIIRTNVIGFCMVSPSRSGLEELAELMKNNKLIPAIDSIYSFKKMPDAFEKANRGHLRGKIIISHSEGEVIQPQ